MAPNKPKPAPWNSFTKAELIRTIKTLSARETKHLNRIAALEKIAADAQALVDVLDKPAGNCTTPDEMDARHGTAFPWEQN